MFSRTFSANTEHKPSLGLFLMSLRIVPLMAVKCFYYVYQHSVNPEMVMWQHSYRCSIRTYPLSRNVAKILRWKNWVHDFYLLGYRNIWFATGEAYQLASYKALYSSLLILQ